jgi:hypothetical protein
MKAQMLFRKLARLFLMIIIMGGLMSLPGQSTSARPLSIGVFTNCESVTDLVKEECDALTAIYNGTDGANWTSKLPPPEAAALG